MRLYLYTVHAHEPWRWQPAQASKTTTKTIMKYEKTRVFGRIYPPDWFEYISFRKPVCLIHSDRKWKDMSTWKENEREHMQNERGWMQNKRNTKGNECNMKAKRRKSMRNENTWMQHARNIKGNERKMKGNLMEIKENMTSVDFRPRMLSHPQKAGKA